MSLIKKKIPKPTDLFLYFRCLSKAVENLCNPVSSVFVWASATYKMVSSCCCSPVESGPLHSVSPKTLWCRFEFCFLEMLPHLTLFRVVHFMTIADQKMRNGEFTSVFQSVSSVSCGRISLCKGLFCFI